MAHLPVETEPAVFEAVWLAVAPGLVVVAAAGNSSAELDALAPRGDSGAILVNAAWPEVHPGPSHVRLPRACRGRRIDACGWGAGMIGLVPPEGTADFGGTPAAAAMIAGVACLLSEAYALRTAPAQFVPSHFVRDLLRTDTGVPGRAAAFATRVETDRTGRLPDLRAPLAGRRFSEA